MRPGRGGEGLRLLSPGRRARDRKPLQSLPLPCLWSQLLTQGEGMPFGEGPRGYYKYLSGQLGQAGAGCATWVGTYNPCGSPPALSPARFKRFRSDLALCPRPTWEKLPACSFASFRLFVCVLNVGLLCFGDS